MLSTTSTATTNTWRHTKPAAAPPGTNQYLSRNDRGGSKARDDREAERESSVFEAAWIHVREEWVRGEDERDRDDHDLDDRNRVRVFRTEDERHQKWSQCDSKYGHHSAIGANHPSYPEASS